MDLRSLTVAYIATLGFVAFLIWMRTHKVDNEWRSEIQKLKDEVSQLALSVGLRRRGQPGMQPPTFGGPA